MMGKWIMCESRARLGKRGDWDVRAALVACEAVCAKVATAYGPDADVADDLRALGLSFLPMNEAAALRAAPSPRGA